MTTPDAGFPPLVRMGWRAVTFVHWPVPPASIAPLLPPGLAVDQHDGTAWVTLAPLVMERPRLARPAVLPPVPSFPQTNFRTYVVGPGGMRGAWFFSVDATRAPVVLGARALLGAPFHLGALTAELADPTLRRFRGRRRAGGPHAAAYGVVVERGPSRAPVELDAWLTDRWRAYTRRAGRLVELPVRHGPWSLRDGIVRELTETVSAAAGVAVGEPALVHWCEDLDDVEFGAPRLALGRVRRSRGAGIRW